MEEDLEVKGFIIIWYFFDVEFKIGVVYYRNFRGFLDVLIEVVVNCGYNVVRVLSY